MNRLSGHAPAQGNRPPNGSHQRTQSYNTMPIPTQSNGHVRERNDSFSMARSPPALAGKNTKHVPCKFFRQGQCQAGNSCPFNHNLDPMAHLAPCKYFMKGNCKFGAKCALGHYLPNGHRVNKGDLRPYHATNTNGYDLNGKNQNDPPPPFPSIDEPYLGSNPPQDYYPDIPFLEDEYDSHPDRYNDAFRNDKPYTYDIPIGSPPTSHFGSPPSDIRSPRHKWPSALDAPLPPSYTGSVPNYATIGHVSGSVPDKFGLASPANSTISQNVASPGVKESLIQPPTQNPKTTPLGASPAHAETSISGRILYSEKYRQKSRPPMSSSLPVRDFDTRLGLDSDLPLLPSDLHDELLTPGDKMRGFSRLEQETSGSFKEGSDSLAIPRRSSNVVGSPPAASSPSRFHHIFKEQKEKSSNIGVVGSPLRESWLLGGDSTVSPRPGMQMSGISQALGQMNLDRTETGDSTGLRPNNIRGGYARQISSPGLTSTRIDEEGDPATFFPMDDESTRRGAVAWNDSQNSTSRKTTGEVSMPRGMPIKNGVKPIFGFHG